MRYDSEHKARTRQRVLKEASLAIREEGAGNIGALLRIRHPDFPHFGQHGRFEAAETEIKITGVQHGAGQVDGLWLSLHGQFRQGGLRS